MQSPANTLNVQPYSFNPADLVNLIEECARFTLTPDNQPLNLKYARKLRASIKKKIIEIKKVHITNKKIILKFKQDADADNDKLYKDLIDAVVYSFEAIDARIRRDETLSKASSAGIAVSNVAPIESMAELTAKAGMSIGPLDPVDSIPMQAPEFIVEGDASRSLPPTTDAALLNHLDHLSVPGKGWKISVSPEHGLAIYQINDPKAPTSIRDAIRQHIGSLRGISIASGN